MIDRTVITYRVSVTTAGGTQSFSFKTEEKINAFIACLKDDVSYVVAKRTTTEEIIIVK